VRLADLARVRIGPGTSERAQQQGLSTGANSETPACAPVHCRNRIWDRESQPAKAAGLKSLRAAGSEPPLEYGRHDWKPKACDLIGYWPSWEASVVRRQSADTAEKTPSANVADSKM
jgi:hypothetical protein